MKKCLVLCLLLVTLLVGCISSANATDIVIEKKETQYTTCWAVYDGVLNYINEEGEMMKFAVKYLPGYDELENVNLFWIGYMPEGEDVEEASVFCALSSLEHHLIISDDGEYILMVNEEAIKSAYEFWLECQIVQE